MATGLGQGKTLNLKTSLDWIAIQQAIIPTPHFYGGCSTCGGLTYENRDHEGKYKYITYTISGQDFLFLTRDPFIYLVFAAFLLSSYQ